MSSIVHVCLLVLPCKHSCSTLAPLGCLQQAGCCKLAHLCAQQGVHGTLQGCHPVQQSALHSSVVLNQLSSRSVSRLWPLTSVARQVMDAATHATTAAQGAAVNQPRSMHPAVRFGRPRRAPGPPPCWAGPRAAGGASRGAPPPAASPPVHARGLQQARWVEQPRL